MLSFCLLLIAVGPIARSTGATDLEKLYVYFSCFDLIALGCAAASRGNRFEAEFRNVLRHALLAAQNSGQAVL